MPRSIVPAKLKQIATGKFEIFKPVITLTPRQRGVFLRDQGKYLRRLLEKQGHKVNAFYLSTVAERKAKKILDSIPSDHNAQFIELYIHIMQGGGMASTYM